MQIIQENTFRFLGLPRELRSEIYKHSLVASFRTLFEHPIDTCGKLRQRGHGTAILSINHQIRDEVLSDFRRLLGSAIVFTACQCLLPSIFRQPGCGKGKCGFYHFPAYRADDPQSAMLLSHIPLRIDIKSHDPDDDFEHEKHEYRTFIAIGINNVKIVAAMIETILQRYRDSITSDARSNLQHIFHYGFKYDIHDRHASLAHYHTEVSYVVSAIPMHQDIVTTQWETREGPKTTDEPLNTAGVLWRTGHRLELLTLGTQLFNIGNALSKKNNFYSALFNYRGALEVIRRAQMMFYWEKASLERFLPYLEAVIRSNIIVCCAKQAGTSRNITPSAMQFYQAEMESDRLQSKHMTWGIGSAVWLMAILQIFTRQSSASVTKKLELFIRHMPNDEKMGVARSLIELVKSQSLQDQVMKPSLTNMLLRSLDDFTYPDILLGQPEFKWGLDFAQYSGEFYLLESLDPTEAKRYRQILQLGGIWEEICGTKIKTAQYDKLLGKYTTFIQGKKNHGGETGCVCKPTIIVSFHEIRVGVVCKTGLCMGLTGLTVKTTDSDTEKREAPLYGLEVRFENFFSIESEEERPRAVSTPKV